MSNEFKARNGIITPFLKSTVSTGSAPLQVDSTTVVTNLNADLLDGRDGDYYLNLSNFTELPDPQITLAGDLAGSVTLTNLQSGTLTATIIADAVELGTKTTGNYVATIAGTGNQISVTGSGVETAAITLSLPQDIATSSSPTFSNLTLTGELRGPSTLIIDPATVGDTTGIVSIKGNLTVEGNRLYVGLEANAVRFPNAKAAISVTPGGIQQNNSSVLGLIAEGVATSTLTATGLYGVGYSSSTQPAGGIIGEGHASDPSFEITATGVLGYAVDTHAGDNVGLFAKASGGTNNYALYMESGNIKSDTSQTWTLADDQLTALSFSSVGKLGILTVKTSNGLEGVAVSGTLTVSGNTTISGNLIINGTTTTVNSTVITIDDPILTLGGDTAPTSDDGKDRGIEFRYYSGSSDKLGFFGFDNSSSKFTFITNATNSSEVFSGTKGTVDAYVEWTDVLSKPSPVITLAGDLTGSVTLSSLTSGTLTATIAPDSVALGTDTTGNYAADISAGDGISLTGTAGEGTSYTVAHADTSSQATVTNTDATVIQSISLDTFGHLISIDSINLDTRYYTETETDARFLQLSGGTMTGQLTLHADPTNALDAATKQYVDNVAAGLKAAPAVEVATTANLSANYSNGTLGVGATLTATSNGAFPTIDDITVSTITPGLNGVLVKNQSNAAHNGRYNLTQIGDASTPWILTRCGVCDQNTEIPGSYVFVKAGTTLSNSGWVAYVANPATFVVGTDNIIYFQFSGAGTYVAGTGLDLTGNTFSNTGVLSVNTLTGNITAQNLLDAIKSVDGPASNLDADLLDGQQGSYYLDWNNTTNKPDPTVTVTLTGDVTGTGSGTLTDLGDGSISFVTTIAANSVELGIDTTGNYVAGISAGADTGIAILGSGTESATVTISGVDATSSSKGVASFNSNDFTVTSGAVSISNVNLGTQTSGNYVATIAGTTNQISVANSGTESAAVTLSLSQDIASTSSPTFAGAVLGNINVGITSDNIIDTASGNLTLNSAGGTTTIDDNLVVSGNLTVNGNTTTVNSTVTTLDDPILTLGGDTAPAGQDLKDRGIEFRWHDNTNAKVGFFGFDDSTGKFTFIPDATNNSEVFSGTKGTLDARIEWADVLSKPDPVITLAGDLTGSVTLTDLGSATLTATIAPDSVALGTDTTGDYVATVAAGPVGTSTSSSGLTITGTGESAAVQIAHADTSTQANVSNSNGVVLQSITLDTFGHLTNVQSVDLDNRFYTQSVADSKFIDAAGDTMTGFLTLHADPLLGMQAATKQYVDTFSGGVKIKSPAEAATTATLATLTGGTVTYSNGINNDGVGATLTLSIALTILDGVTLSNSDRILIKNESTLAYNGIYIRTSSTVLTRAAEYDTASEIEGGEIIFVKNGSVHGGTNWYQARDVDVVGTDDIIFEQFTVGGDYTAGTGLQLNGTEFSINSTVATLTDTQTLTNKTIDAAENTITELTNDNLSGSAGITNANLENSSVTLGTTEVSLGQSTTTLAGLSSVTSTSFTGALIGNASTATKLQTARTISITGDIQGSASFDGSSNVEISTVIQPNSIVLGVDTTGNFVASVNSTGSTISVSGSGLESASINLELATTGVTSGSYGTSTTIPSITVDAYGRVTDITTTSISVSLGVNSDTGTETIALGTETLSIVGGEGIDTSITAGSNTITISGEDATAAATSTLANKGIASFSSGDFDVTTGFVTIKAAGVDNAQLANSSLTLGSTSISLGDTVTTVAGLTQVDIGNIRLAANSITTTDASNTLYIDPAPINDNGGTVVIKGNLQVDGTTTTINSTQVTIDDPVFMLGGDVAPSIDDNLDRGIAFQWHNGTNAKLGFFGYDDSAAEFVFIADAVETTGVFGPAVTDVYGNLKFSKLALVDTTDSSSTTSGALTVAGGVGIAKKVYVGDDIVGAGTATSAISGFTIDGGTY